VVCGGLLSGRVFPNLIIIDQCGKVAGLVNYRDHEGLEAMIRALLSRVPDL
jgi:hypothetical protein